MSSGTTSTDVKGERSISETELNSKFSTVDNEVSLFRRSSEFVTLKKSFNLKDENFNFSEVKMNNHFNEESKFYTIAVDVMGRKDLMHFIKLPTNNYMVVYNKINVNKESLTGYSELYDESKNFYIDYKIKKTQNGYEMTLNDVLTSKRLGILKAANVAAVSCVGETYKKMKDACDADDDCKLLCDAADIFAGQCTGAMIASALYICATN